MTTKAQVANNIGVVKAIAEAIREAGRIPSGHLYAALMTQGMSLDQYNSVIGILKRSGVVKENFHKLIWCGKSTS